MTKEELDNYFKCLESINKAKYALKTIKTIKWETDVTKLDLSVLRNCWIKNEHEYQSIKIEYRPKDTICCMHHARLFHDVTDDAKTMCNTIELIQLGNVNIIPPIFVKLQIIIDGEITETSNEYMIDGNHRLRAANHFQLDMIPIVICERVRQFKFTKSKWDITYDSETLVFESFVDKKRYEFKLLEWNLKQDGTDELIVERDC